MRSGRWIWIGLAVSVALFVALTVSLFVRPSHPGMQGETASNGAAETLLVFCAAGIQEPVSKAFLKLKDETGIEVQLQFGGSQTQLASLEVAGRGDLYITADDSYIELARKKGLIEEVIPLARQQPVLAVKKGNPKAIRSLQDLWRGDVKLAQANPDAAAIGKLTRAALQKAAVWDRVHAATTVYKTTVNDVGNDLKVGTVDAGFIWDATLSQYPDLEAVAVPELEGVSGRVSAAVLRSSRQPTRALAAARYLAAPDRGLAEFKRAGYRVEDGDPWAAKPVLRMLSGAMLRPAIEETIKAFEAREGVEVVRVYNGCGILVAQMRTGNVPDAYFACDRSFMEQVSDLFVDAQDIAQNQLAIIVPRGNPKGIKSLRDLSRAGLRIGVGHEKQCALGALTKETLIQAQYLDAVTRNVTVQSPTGDMLVNQLLTGSLDAVIAYVSNMSAARDRLEGISIDIPCAHAVQPLAVARETPYRQLSTRLAAALSSAASKARFEAEGFQWKEQPAR